MNQAYFDPLAYDGIITALRCLKYRRNDTVKYVSQINAGVHFLVELVGTFSGSLCQDDRLIQCSE